MTPTALRPMLAPSTVGLGRNREDLFYAFGRIGTNGWVVHNPSLHGYRIIAAHHPEERLTIVAVATLTPESDGERHAPTAIFGELTELLSPEHPSAIPVR